MMANLGLIFVVLGLFLIVVVIIANRGNWSKKDTQHKEIDDHCEMVSARLSIQREAEGKFQLTYDKLNDKQKKIIDKEDYLPKGFMFPTRGDYLDCKRYKCEELFSKSGGSE